MSDVIERIPLKPWRETEIPSDTEILRIEWNDTEGGFATTGHYAWIRRPADDEGDADE